MTKFDADAVWRLVQSTEELDKNSHYLYVLLGTYFGDTCSVARTAEGELAGFVTGFRSPTDPDVLFVWQLAVASHLRGRGIAPLLANHVLDRQSVPAHSVAASISPGNGASEGFFRSLADALGWDLSIQPFLNSTDVPAEAGPHNDERLFLLKRPEP